MKRVAIVASLLAIFLFSILSAAYLLKPVHLTINIDQLSGTQTLQKQLFLKSGWGGGSNDFGIEKGGWLPGPMSLATDNKNNLYVLDQQNKRVKEFTPDADLVRNIPIDNSSYEDLAIDETGFIYLLDSVENHLIKKIDKNGEVVRVYKISSDIEPITGLILSDDKVFVEVEHSRLYSIGSVNKAVSLKQQKPRSVEGRLADDFNTDAQIADDGTVKAQISGNHKVDSITIEDLSNKGTQAYSIVSIDYDSEDNIFVILDIAESDKLYNQAKDKLLGLVIGSDGKLKNKFYASNYYYTSHFQKITVSPDGTVYQLQTTSEGVEIWRW